MLSEVLPGHLEILEGKPVEGLPLYPPVSSARTKVALGAQSARGAAWAASLKVGLLQGRSEPNSIDPTVSQVRAAEAYRAVHPTGRVITARNAWVGGLQDAELLAAMGRHDAYLKSRGRDGLPDDPGTAAKKMNILAGPPVALAQELTARTAPIAPDELLITLDPGGLDAHERSRRVSAMAEAFDLKG